MSKKLLLSTLTAIATTGALLSTPVFAAEVTNIKQAYEAVESSDYKGADIQSIKSTRNGYKVKAYTADDQKVRLMVNSTDGAITVHEKRRDCDQDERRGGRKGEGKGRNN